jgi:hypothetical protein
MLEERPELCLASVTGRFHHRYSFRPKLRLGAAWNLRLPRFAIPRMELDGADLGHRGKAFPPSIWR